MKNNNDLVEVGKVSGTFGIRGELKVSTESDFINERFKKGSIINLLAGKSMFQFEVENARVHKGAVLLKLKDHDNINDVEKYVGTKVFAAKLENNVLSEDEFFYDDLLDLKVYNQHDEFIGIVNDLIEIPSGVILEVINDDSRVLIPFVKAFVKEVDEEKIVIEEIEGLR